MMQATIAVKSSSDSDGFPPFGGIATGGVSFIGRTKSGLDERDQFGVSQAVDEIALDKILARPRHSARVRSVAGRARAEIVLPLRYEAGVAITADQNHYHGPDIDRRVSTRAQASLRDRGSADRASGF